MNHNDNNGNDDLAITIVLLFLRNRPAKNDKTWNFYLYIKSSNYKQRKATLPCLWILTDSKISLPLNWDLTKVTFINISSGFSGVISVGRLSSHRPALACGRIQWIKWQLVFLNVSIMVSCKWKILISYSQKP